MGMNELTSARARRAAAKLEVLLAEIEGGRYELNPDTARGIAAHIRYVLRSYWHALDEGGHPVSERQSDRRANG